MSLLHRSRLVAVTAILGATLMAALVVPPPASAQRPGVRLTLASQTPFTVGTKDRSVLEISVVALNETDRTLRDLSVSFVIGAAIRSRTVYATSLVDGPGSEQLVSLSRPQRGTLKPGQTRTFSVRVSLGDPAQAPAIALSTDSLVYPARLELRSGQTSLGGLNTAVIHVVRDPNEARMLLNWRAELTGPIAFNAEGRLANRSMESEVNGGSLGAAAAALRAAATTSERGPIFDLVVQPSVLEDLGRMARGYRRADGTQVKEGTGAAAAASGVLTNLQAVAAKQGSQLGSFAFAAPAIPSLLDAGLRGELRRQREVGRTTTRAMLERWPVAAVERPAQGLLDQGALDFLASTGVRAILGDATTVPRPIQENDFAPPPTARLRTSDGGGVSVVLPDPSIQALLADPDLTEDPVRAAQVVLGELMAIWREQPSPADGVVRGVALSLDASAIPPTLWAPIVQRLSGASWLHAVTGDALIERVLPVGRWTELTDPSSIRFGPDYATGVAEERRNANAYASMLSGPATSMAAKLQHDLLYATASQYLNDEQAGRVWFDQVSNVTSEAFDRVRPSTDQVFTLTSTSGQVPLHMGDPGATPLTVSIKLQSSKFEFPDGDEQVVTLTRPDQVVTFSVEAKASGQQPITVLVAAPSGRVLDEQTLVVRTFAANAIALLVTLLAALGLLALWIRRWYRRQRS